MGNKHKILYIALLVALISTAFALPAFSNTLSSANNGVKNVIILVPDGCTQSLQTLTRWYTGAPLNLDGIVTGTVETWMANSVITDSAPASTAFATGHKSTNGFISVGPRTSDLLAGFTPDAAPYVPLATVLEAAKLQGRATGLVATSTVTHATPAGYAAHNYNRNDELDIMEQMIYNDVDVVFGGGASELFPTNKEYTTSFGAKWVGTRTDGENLYQALISRGYTFVDSKDSMLSVNSGKVWGLFAPSSMQPDIDRAEFAPTEPSLAEMTSQAINLLSQDPDGFFLMVEGSQVDWANHANDPIQATTDFLVFDEAVGVALNFAHQNGNTLVMAFPDHNCGGLTIGSYYQGTNAIGHSYTATTIADVVNPLKGMKISATGLVAKLKGVTDNSTIRSIFNQWWGLNITDADIGAMNLADSYSISEYISKTYTVFGWTTHGHTGDDVPLWAYSTNGNTPSGHYDNTDLAQLVADALNFDLNVAQQRLYVNVADAFTASQWRLSTVDPKNPLLIITIDNKIALLPVSKDVITIYDTSINTYTLEGLVVYAPMINQTFIPQEVVNLLQ
jgi:alkaline phosphatase